MTRKDYVLLAQAIRQAHDNIDNTPNALPAVQRARHQGVDHAARTVAYALQWHFDNFDRERFLRACAGESTDRERRRGTLPRGAGAVMCSVCGTRAAADGKGNPIVLRHASDCPEYSSSSRSDRSYP